MEILTIAIPTYNRNAKLYDQINRIIPQHNNRVKVVIRDNDSPVPISLDECNLTEFNIELVKNNQNIGADANICRCFEECTTKWLWVLSDDDFITPDAIEKVLSEIDHLNDSTIYINFQNNKNFETIGFTPFCESFTPIQYVNSFWMSVCIYNMNYLKPFLRFYYENLSSMIGTLILVLKCLEQNNKLTCVFSEKKIVEYGEVEVSWDKSVYIARSILIVDSFSGDNLKLLNSTIIMSMFNLNLSLILNLPRFSKRRVLKLFLRIVFSRGLLAVIRYNLFFVLKIVVILLMPYKLIKNK